MINSFELQTVINELLAVQCGRVEGDASIACMNAGTNVRTDCRNSLTKQTQYCMKKHFWPLAINGLFNGLMVC